MPPKVYLGYSPNDTYHHGGAHYDVGAYVMVREKALEARKLSDWMLGVYQKWNARMR